MMNLAWSEESDFVNTDVKNFTWVVWQKINLSHDNVMPVIQTRHNIAQHRTCEGK